jgi:hypothetical protein
LYWGGIHQKFPQFVYDYSFYDSSPAAPNSSKQGRIVEELWKNCRKILWSLTGSAAGKNWWKNRPGAKSFYNSSTILPQFFPAALPGEGPQNLSTIFPQFFPAGCLP